MYTAVLVELHENVCICRSPTACDCHNNIIMYTIRINNYWEQFFSELQHVVVKKAAYNATKLKVDTYIVLWV